MISLIVATDLDGVIGRDNDLPWRLPADLRRFRRLTMGKPIIMGRRTHESIGKPLDGRLNIVLTRDRQYRAEGCRIAHTPDEALALAEPAEEVMVIGGAAIYDAFVARAHRIYLTLVQAHVSGDVHFPVHEIRAKWRESDRVEQPADERHEHPFLFLTLERPSP